MDNLIIPPALGILGMVMAFVVYKLVMKYPDGEDKVKKIGDQIHAGALAFMKTEYKYLLSISVAKNDGFDGLCSPKELINSNFPFDSSKSIR